MGPPGPNGYHPFKCLLCNDYKPRAGFKFDGDLIRFNCFNCGVSAGYEELSGRISKNMRRVLTSHGVDDTEISSILNSAFFKPKSLNETITVDSLKKKVNLSTPPVKLPLDSFKLGSTEQHLNLQEEIVEFLVSRHVDLNKYTFYFSTSERMKKRVIVPFYRNGTIIYWQARSISKLEKKRYDNSAASRDAVIFNIDQLYRYSAVPLFVCEGVFDAMMFDGIAVLGSQLNDAKLTLLSNSNRRLVFPIDKDANGAKLATSVLNAGWEIAFSPDGTKDLNDSVKKYGKAWTALQLVKSIPKDRFSANLKISLLPKKWI